MLTTGQIITTSARQGANVGYDAAAYDQPLRDQIHLHLRDISAQVRTLAPWWWKHGNGTVTVLANATKGSCPADFNNFGTKGQVWLQGSQRPLDWIDPELLVIARQSNPNGRSDPTHYCLRTITATGVAELDVWPTPGRDVTLDLLDYSKRMPELVDVPLAPGVAIGAAVGLTGAYTYRALVVHAAGKTEAGFVSAVVNPVNQKVNLTGVSVSNARSASAREVYRNTALVTNVWKLALTINDNVTTDFTGESSADGALGATMPTLDQAVTGMEQFPSDFHESIFIDGVIQKLRAARKNTPFKLFSEDWSNNVRRMWADQRQDRHVVRHMANYGSRPTIARRSWRRTL